MGLKTFSPKAKAQAYRDPETGRFVSSSSSGSGSGSGSGAGKAEQANGVPALCSTPEPQFPDLPESLGADRLFLLKTTSKLWANGTVLHYAFLGNVPSRMQAVRDAFQAWKDVGIGLKFVETTDLSEAKIRVSFAPTGSWSYVGRDAVDLVPDRRKATMNIGWEVEGDNADTAIHEVGHALGFPHEHQNGNSGITWDVPAVIRTFSGPPNNWDEGRIRHNILNKHSPENVEGSDWDPNSVMHYPFGPGLILAPPSAVNGINPAPGLSAQDKAQVKIFYPDLAETNPEDEGVTPYQELPLLAAGRASNFELAPAEQIDFRIEPDATQKYSIKSFGPADVSMAVFVWRNGDWRFHAGGGNAGNSADAEIQTRLVQGQFYGLRLRALSDEHMGQGAVGLFRR